MYAGAQVAHPQVVGVQLDRNVATQLAQIRQFSQGQRTDGNRVADDGELAAYVDVDKIIARLSGGDVASADGGGGGAAMADEIAQLK